MLLIAHNINITWIGENNEKVRGRDQFACTRYRII